MLISYDTIFEEYLINIALTKSQAQRIDSSLIGLSELFVQSFVGDVEIYTQGSFATNTIVKPLTEHQSPNSNASEYDVDIVLQRSTWGEAADTLTNVREVISNSERYSSLLKPPIKQSCERIEYAPEQSGSGFHVDLVPIKIDQSTIRFVAMRAKNEWRTSDPTVIINWFNDLRTKHKFLAANVLCLKRMRDIADLQLTIPSIIILALVGRFYEDKGSYAADLLHMLKKINELLNSGQIEIKIPNVNENLAEKWNTTQLRIVRSYFADVNSKLEQSFADDDLETIRQYLSDDFPINKYLENLHSLRSKDWNIQLNGSLERSVITPIPEPKNLNRFTRRLLRFTKKGQPVVFNAEPYKLKGNRILQWQVLNSRNSDQIRGEFFHAKKANDTISANDFENHETVSYRGLHWIRYFIVDQDTGTVEVTSKKYSVELKL